MFLYLYISLALYVYIYISIHLVTRENPIRRSPVSRHGRVVDRTRSLSNPSTTMARRRGRRAQLRPRG